MGDVESAETAPQDVLTATLGESLAHKESRNEESGVASRMIAHSESLTWPGFLRAHPFMALAAGLAIGVTVAGLLRRR